MPASPAGTHINISEQQEWPAGACSCGFQLVLVIPYFTSSFPESAFPADFKLQHQWQRQQPYRDYPIAFHNGVMLNPLKNYMYTYTYIFVYLFVYINI